MYPHHRTDFVWKYLTLELKARPQEIDYLLPGIKPTGKRLEIALVGVIGFRGDKLCFEFVVAPVTLKV